MSLVDLNGNPIVSRQTAEKRSLDDYPVMSDAEIAEFQTYAQSILESGQPLNIPAAVPTALIIGFAATIKHLYTRISSCPHC